MTISAEQSPHRGRYNAQSNYAKSFIEEVVNAVNEGLPLKEAMRRYDISKGTLRYWVEQHGSAAYRQGRKRRASASLKRTVVRAVEQGIMTVREARIAYNLKADSTIRRWRKELKQENTELVTSNPASMDKKPADNKPSASAPAEVKALQKALQDAELKIAALNTLIDVAEEQLKINIRKKPGAKQ
jgi:transposase-like protein